MRIGVTGGTGLIGSALCRRLVQAGNELVLFGRNRARAEAVAPTARFVKWELETQVEEASVLSGFDAFVHLAGEPIAGGRWTAERKQLIWQSRVVGTRNLIEGFQKCGEAPGVLISSSAVGFYGSRGDEELDEDSQPGRGFLPEVAVRWEEEARKGAELGSRLVLLRTGIVLSRDGGALSKMLLPFRLGLGGRLGRGKQFMSWIHLNDEVELIHLAIREQHLEGPLNATAPTPVRNQDFVRLLGQTLGRPVLLPVPGFLLRMTLGEMADALLLEGQRVLPRKATDAGFKFRFPQLADALSDLVVKS